MYLLMTIKYFQIHIEREFTTMPKLENLLSLFKSEFLKQWILVHNLKKLNGFLRYQIEAMLVFSKTQSFGVDIIQLNQYYP